MNMYIELAGQALLLALILSAPPLLASLVVGLVISLLQALTQVQEQTLTFVPKILITLLIVILAAGWMLQKLLTFSQRIFEAILQAGRPG
jgi:flagellar biosynthesis protein FliQ